MVKSKFEALSEFVDSRTHDKQLQGDYQTGLIEADVCMEECGSKEKCVSSVTLLHRIFKINVLILDREQ